MKLRYTILLLLLAVIQCSFAQRKNTPDPKARAAEFARKAVALINEKRADEALTMLDSAIALAPGEPHYYYERALAFFTKEDYYTAIDILAQLTTAHDAPLQYFQLLADAYSYTNRLDEAEKLLESQVERFPDSGALFHSLGLVAMRRRDAVQAIQYWEHGMMHEPRYTLNYYEAAKFYSRTTDRIWTILYAEAFVNQEPGSRRSEEMSRFLYEAYAKSLRFAGDSSFAEFCQAPMMAIVGEDSTAKPFEIPFLNTINAAFKPLLDTKQTRITIAALHDLRRHFIEEWYAREHDKSYPNLMFQRQKELLDKGYLEAYDYWLMNKESPEEFQKWYATNKDSFKKFLVWFEKNPMKFDAEHKFARYQ